MKKKSLSPYVIIALSFLIVILIGTILLKLPISIKEDGSLTWIDSLFIATSATTITGLTSISNVGNTFTFFGKFIIGLLIQIGGLSFITLSTYVLSVFGVKISMKDRTLIKETLNQDSYSGLVRLVRKIIPFTIIVELIGFIINLFVFIPDYGYEGIGISLFHTVSSFNNSGFDILGVTNNLIGYKDNLLLNISTMSLIVIGGLGFVVINDLFEKKFKYKKLNIHSKIVLNVTLFLILFGFISIKIIERDNITFLQALFQSITARTAGFSTISMSNLNTLSLLILMFLMFIGGSPASTAGGIKTTTFYILLRSIFGSNKKIIINNRYISGESKNKAYKLMSLYIIIIMISTFIIIARENSSLIKSIFEVTSAISNTGLSMDFTPTLKPLSKLILILDMYIGRVGPLTFINLFFYKKEKPSINYVEEKIIIG